MSSSRGSSQPRNWTVISCIAGIFFTSWATREDPGYAVVTLKGIIKAKALPPGSSAQKAEITAVTRAHLLADIHTGSHYAFSVGHIHGQSGKQGGFSPNKDIKQASEILSLFEAVYKPSHMA